MVLGSSVVECRVRDLGFMQAFCRVKAVLYNSFMAPAIRFISSSALSTAYPTDWLGKS